MTQPGVLAALAAGRKVFLQLDLFDYWAAQPVIVDPKSGRRPATTPKATA